MTTPPVSLGQALRFWFKLGCISFGGPAGQIAIMHRELVEERRWISERRFLHALNYCMLLPGPEAQQLATYLGWLMHRTAGGLAAGLLFVLPSLLLLVLLSWLYMVHGQQPLVQGIFYGIKPAVVALVAHAAWRIGGRVLGHPALWALAAAAFVALWFFDAPFPAIVTVAALLGWWGSRHWPQVFQGGGHGAGGKTAVARAPAWVDDQTPLPAHARFSRSRLWRVLAVGIGLWLVAMAALLAWQGLHGLFTQMAWFFTKAALLTFGGAYAVLPYVTEGAVEHFGWLSAAQMMDGLALGESTPGPLIMVVAFVGFLGGWQLEALGPQALLAAGVLAACVATFFTFLPSFVFIFAGAPFIESTQGKLAFSAPLTAISAAVVGVIAQLALFFAVHVLWPQGKAGTFDAVAAAGVLLAALALWRFKLGVLPLLGAAALAGMGLSLLR